MIQVALVHEMDPTGDRIGGIETYVRDWIHFAPKDIGISVIGVSTDPVQRPVGQWSLLELRGKSVSFFPVLSVTQENRRDRIPFIAKFISGLYRYRSRLIQEPQILEGHRIETLWPFIKSDIYKILFDHGQSEFIRTGLSENRWRHFPRLYRQLENRLIRRVDRVHVVNTATTAAYRRRFPERIDRIRYFPTWVDGRRYFPYALPKKTMYKRRFLLEHKLPLDSKIVLFAGRLEDQKDPMLLLESFRETQPLCPSSHLVIAGGGSLKPKLENAVLKAGLSSRVLSLGPVPSDRVAALMRIADVFLLTARAEAGPRCVLEALSSGLPVVTTDVGDARKMLHPGKAGFICPDRSPENLGRAVADLLEKSPSACPACVHSVQDYRAENVLARLFQEYRDLGAANP